ncbi:MAG: zinc ribbon domain-containing protein [Polyangiaceae bacterium]
MFCFICGAEAQCPKSGEHSAVKKRCSEKPGALWVHVVDDVWSEVDAVDVELEKSRKTDKTQKNGFAKFDPMDSGEEAASIALGSDLKKKYDLPKASKSPTYVTAGQINYLVFQLERRAALRVKVHAKKGGERTFDGADVTLTAKTKSDGGTKSTAGGGIADFEDRSADGYEITAVLSEKDAKNYYCPDTPVAFTLAPGQSADEPILYEVSPLARPKVKVVEKKGGDPIGGVKVHLKPKKGSAVALEDTLKATGLAELAGDEAGLRGGEHDVELQIDELVYVKLAAPPKFTFADGSTETHEVQLARRARPKFRVIDKDTKMPVEGVVIELTAAKDSAKRKIAATRNSGNTELADGEAGLVPDQYAIAVSADHYAPKLHTPANVTFAEADEKLVVIEVETPKGAIRFLINRYDGLAMVGRVTFTLAKKSAPTTILHTVTTAARTVTEQREGKRKVDVLEDWKEVPGLDRGTYVLAIQNLDSDVLDKQVMGQSWKIGPAGDGKMELEVTPGKTTEIRFTVHKYKKAQFIGYSIQPGYADGARCPNCFNQYAASAASCPTCSVPLMPKRCPNCHSLHPASATECCDATLVYLGAYKYCTTCKKYPGAVPLCCGAPPVLKHVYSCDDGACKHAQFADFILRDTMSSSVVKCPLSHKLKVVAEQIYKGLPSNGADLHARCAIMKKAIETAEAKALPKKDDELKIFMGPEFFFRGKDGTYAAHDLAMIMDSMREETKKTKYKDWLFVFGTAIGAMPGPETHYDLRIAETAVGTTVKVTHGVGGRDHVNVCKKVPNENVDLPPAAQWKLDAGGANLIRSVAPIDEDTYSVTLSNPANVTRDAACKLVAGDGTEIVNYALVQRGGPDAVAGLRESIVYKEKVSHIDFLRTRSKTWDTEREIFLQGKQVTVLPTAGGDDKYDREKNPLSGEANKSGLGGGSVVLVDGITIGLEVCLDHAEQKLHAYYATNPKGVGKVQIQLIPSWGMSIKKKSVVGMAGTLVFNVDGPAGSDAAKLPSAPPCKPAKLATPTSEVVDEADEIDVDYLDHGDLDTITRTPKTKNAKLEPKYDLLVVKHEHQVNRAGPGPSGFAWVDIYAPEDIPKAEPV